VSMCPFRDKNLGVRPSANDSRSRHNARL
jgi:hypothetical protein